MTRGKTHGDNRTYQLLCRDVLMHEHHSLTPFKGDGVEAGGTVWTLDVALQEREHKLVVAECRRRKQAVKQDEVAALAYKPEQVREDSITSTKMTTRTIFTESSKSA